MLAPVLRKILLVALTLAVLLPGRTVRAEEPARPIGAEYDLLFSKRPVESDASPAPDTAPQADTAPREDTAEGNAAANPAATPGTDSSTEEEHGEQYITAEVLEVSERPDGETQDVKLRLTSGPDEGEELRVTHYLSGDRAVDIPVDEDDDVLLWKESAADSSSSYAIADHLRSRPLLFLAVLFMALILGIGRKQGAKALVSLIVTLGVVYYLLIPGLLAGYSPILLAIVTTAIVSMFTFFVVIGFGKKAFAAILGTVGGVAVAGYLALFVGRWAHLTGLASGESRMLLYSVDADVNYQGILFCGVIIGALGAVMDVAVSVSSATEEVVRHHPKISRIELFQSALNVGKDIMGTMTNTLILAYTGSSLSLLLLFELNDTEVTKFINLDMVATEVMRALAGSIGLLIAIPLTAAIAVYGFHSEPQTRGESRTPDEPTPDEPTPDRSQRRSPIK